MLTQLPTIEEAATLWDTYHLTPDPGKGQWYTLGEGGKVCGACLCGVLAVDIQHTMFNRFIKYTDGKAIILETLKSAGVTEPELYGISDGYEGSEGWASLPYSGYDSYCAGFAYGAAVRKELIRRRVEAQLAEVTAGVDPAPVWTATVLDPLIAVA